mgnify:CR=1 FL=1
MLKNGKKIIKYNKGKQRRKANDDLREKLVVIQIEEFIIIFSLTVLLVFHYVEPFKNISTNMRFEESDIEVAAKEEVFYEMDAEYYFVDYDEEGRVTRESYYGTAGLSYGETYADLAGGLAPGGRVPGQIHAQEIHRQTADAHHQTGAHTGRLHQKQHREHPEGALSVPVNEGVEQGREQIGKDQRGDIPVELGAHPGPPAEGGQVPQELPLVHLVGQKHKAAVNQDKRNPGGQQTAQPPLHKPKGISIFPEGKEDAEARQKQEHIHRAYGVPFGDVQVLILLEAAVVVQEMPVDHNEDGNAHQSGLIPADPVVWLHNDHLG